MKSSPMKNLFFTSLRSKQIAFTITFATLFVAVITLVIYEGNKKTVTLAVNGEQEEIRTHASTVSKLLSDNEMEVSEHDIVSPSMDTPIQDGLEIRWEQSKQVAITVDEEKQSLWTTKSTVGEVLEEAAIELAEHDEVSPALTAKLDENNVIEINKAYEFMLVDGGEEAKYWSTSTTIGDFLNRENIKLDEFDRVEDELDSQIQPGAVVEIVRVEKETATVEEEEKFTIETKSDNSLLKGREKVVQAGQKGVIAREYEIIKENGKEVSRTLLAEKTVKEPTKQIVSVGTKVVVADAGTSANTKTVSRNNSSSPAGGKEFYVTATAYTADCNGCSGITATGINLKANRNLKVIAVDPSVIPLGSKVWVEGYGYAVAGDTGGAIKGNRIDLHMASKSSAYQFGRRQVKVKVMN